MRHIPVLFALFLLIQVITYVMEPAAPGDNPAPLTDDRYTQRLYRFLAKAGSDGGDFDRPDSIEMMRASK